MDRAIFITVNVEKNFFNRVCRNAVATIELDDSFSEQLQQKNEFIRFKHKEWYADVLITKMIHKNQDGIYTLLIGDLIDYDKPSLKTFTKTFINKINKEKVKAKTIQEAAELLQINIRHVKLYKK